MSRLRELRLHGFKSFADPTRFAFEPGVNAVIGPNGSGKSNMADAVRWVLGEQSNRSLRTRRADDVIFAGSDQRRAQGMAEAILTLDNRDGWLPIDFAEVSIGRRAYRSGESEYLINGARARLRDVVELLGEGRLGANELVVVGQGTVDAALSLRPDERRQLFEEAAGVKNLQVRKNESSVRLARARDNLTRVADLIGELKPQVRRLALQAEHQQQHDALGRRARALVIESGSRRERVARSSLGDARRAAAAAEGALEAHRGEQAAARQTVADAEARYWEAEASARLASEAREATRETLIRAEARAEALSARRAELDARLARIAADLARARHELEAVSAGGDALDDRLASALEASAAGERQWRDAVDALAAADADLLAAEEALADVRRQESARIADVARRTEQQAGEAARRERAVAERGEALGRLDEARARLEGAVAGRREAEAALLASKHALESAASERDDAQARADAAGQQAAELSERLMLLRAEESAIRDRAGEAAQLGTVLARAGWAPLLDKLDVPEDAWPAIEAVVGGELDQALEWRSHDPTALVGDARGAARLLDAGPAPEAPGEREAALRAVGASRTVADWVGPRAPRAFHRAVVAPDLASLLEGWHRLPAGWCAVTAFGDLADGRGVALLRGRGEPQGSVAARRHARRSELEADLKRTEAEHAAATADAHRAAELLRRARDRHLAAREAHEAAERGVRGANEEHESAAASAERAAGELEAIESELATLPQQPPPAPSVEAVTAELQAAERRAADARARREASATDRDRARDAWNAAKHAADEVEADAGRRRDRALIDASIAQLEAEENEVRTEATAAADAAREATDALDAARRADVAAGDERAEREHERETRRAELLELERSTAGAAARLAELERAAQDTAVEASRREDAVAAAVRERELALEGLPDAEPPATDHDPELSAELTALDAEELAAELRRVRRTLSQIGSVNPFAVEEHREMRARLDDLSGQDADLQAAIDATEELIARLEAEITERFDAAFQAIGERFDEYCRLLFSGGSASLQLADEADGDAPGGIEIVVRPPGKRLQRLAMLSGGERALTGVALLFAMLTVNPVPFCILDEVDAALDEANIGRFAAALRRLAESIDFVVITHNRATIEVADTIYGVTMTDAAVSRVLSLRLADVAVEATA